MDASYCPDQNCSCCFRPDKMDTISFVETFFEEINHPYNTTCCCDDCWLFKIVHDLQQDLEKGSASTDKKWSPTEELDDIKRILLETDIRELRHAVQIKLNLAVEEFPKIIGFLPFHLQKWQEINHSRAQTIKTMHLHIQFLKNCVLKERERLFRMHSMKIRRSVIEFQQLTEPSVLTTDPDDHGSNDVTSILKFLQEPLN